MNMQYGRQPQFQRQGTGFFASHEHHNFSVLKNMTDLTPEIQNHLKNVYASLAIALFCASAGAYVHVYTNILQGGGFLGLLATIGCLVMVMMTPNTPETSTLRFAYFCGFGFFKGLSIGPLLDVVLMIDPSIIPTAFMGTCLIFASFTISALTSQRRSYLFLGGILYSAISLFFWLSLFNIFIGSTGLFTFQLYGGLMMMSAFVLYDTQLIVEKASLGQKDYLWHSVELFIDFVGIFVRLLIILAQNSQGGNRKKKDNRR
eukprot:Nk52_evm59s270 gene=Nk52_evmTU59s270